MFPFQITNKKEPSKCVPKKPKIDLIDTMASESEGDYAYSDDEVSYDDNAMEWDKTDNPNAAPVSFRGKCKMEMLCFGWFQNTLSPCD